MDKYHGWGARLFQSDCEKLAREGAFKPATMTDISLISLRQMERFFADRFQCTPGEWVREYRFRLAKDLLAQGLSSKAVATELNFGSPAHFCHQFKKFYGVPPGDFWPTGNPPSKPARSENSSGQAR
jgi:AraC-like DNA-binding protein